MKKPTLSLFLAESGIPSSLVRSTVRQCGDWETFQEIAQDVCNHGANAGFSGFIYYSETIPFAKRNKKALMEMCKEQAEECYGKGYSVGQFIAGFNCVDCDAEQVAIALYTGKGDDLMFFTISPCA